MEVNESKKLSTAREQILEHAEKHELYKNITETKGHIVFGRGDDEAKILFIGEAPGFSENQQGKPFVGRSGKLLDEWIKELGIKENEYAVINVVPIIPLSPDKKIRPPTEQEIEYFFPFTLKIIEQINPQIIVLLGRSAASIFDENLKPKQTKKETIGKTQTTLYFIYHPAYYLRNGKKGLEDVQPLKKILEEEKGKKQTTLGNYA
jgi:DNA polymerase